MLAEQRQEFPSNKAVGGSAACCPTLVFTELLGRLAVFVLAGQWNQISSIESRLRENQTEGESTNNGSSGDTAGVPVKIPVCSLVF